jgi:hypothetical protein
LSQAFVPWSGTLRVELQELPGEQLRVACVLPDLFGDGTIETLPVDLDAEEAAAFCGLFEQAVTILRKATQRQSAAAAPIVIAAEESERPGPLYTDPRALSPRRRR